MKMKRTGSAVLALSMVLALFPVQEGKAEGTKADEAVIAEYVFEDSDVTDLTVADTSGKGHDAKLMGEGASVANGILTLPGGAKGSSAAYVELPGSMFEGQDTLTITTWLKNETGANNYTAMYFGTTTKHIGGGTADMPLHYWVLNPCQPNGMFKSAWTDGDNAQTPYSTETAVSSTPTSADWGMYTTVITPNRIIGYYNGLEVCSEAKTKTTSDFGTGLVAYLGRSGYNDIFYKGGIYGVKVYGRAMEQQEIWDMYYGDHPYGVDMQGRIDAALAADADALDLGDLSRVTGNLTLPTSGRNGSRIVWSSSSDAIAADGTVVRDPKENREVTLTAQVSIKEKAQTRKFQATVMAVNPQNIVQEYLDAPGLTDVLDADRILPGPTDAKMTVSWKSSNPSVLKVQSEGGVQKAVVIRPAAGEDDAKVTLTADVSYKDGTETYTASRNYDVTVRAQYGYAYLMAYTNKSEAAELGNSLHIAVSTDGVNYEALNSNTGICFANNEGGQKNSSPNRLRNLCLFRKTDGTYGLAATNESLQKYIYLFDSENLVDFTNERRLAVDSKVSGGLKVEAADGGYKIYWSDGSKQYGALTNDLKTVVSQGEETYTPDKAETAGQKPSGAEPWSILPVSKAEYRYVMNRLGVVRNTRIKPVQISAEAGPDLKADELLPKTVTAEYNDGSEAQMNVVWDTADLDITREGTYKVAGTIQQKKYPNPFITQRADPCILKGNDGYYYFTATYPMKGRDDGNDKIVLRRAETIEGLAEAEEVTIWDCDDPQNESVPREYRYVWAPEIRLVKDQYYVFYTSSIDRKATFSIRPHLLKCTNPDDIMNPKSWEQKGLMQKAPSDTKAFTKFSLDMTVFENLGRWYVAWAQADPYSSIYIAEINPDEPWKCISEPIIITTPEYSWERIAELVNEGPSVIKSPNGKIYLSYSASGTGPEYCMGLMSIDADADILDVSAWKKQAFPVLTSSDVPGEYGPGHNSFTVDEEGNDVFVYHARGEACYRDQCDWAKEGPLYDPCRDARLKRVHWSVDGAPILKMTYEEELADPRTEAVITIVPPEDPAVKALKEEIKQVKPKKTEYALTVGKTADLAIAYPDKFKERAKAAGLTVMVSYECKDKAASVDADGKITADGQGTATVKTTISLKDGTGEIIASQKFDVKVTVKAAGGDGAQQSKPHKITLNVAKKINIGMGESVKMKATVKNKAGKTLKNQKITWTVNKKGKKIVSLKSGRIKALQKTGTATVTAKTANGKTASVKVTVKKKPTRIKITSPKKGAVLKVGKKLKLKTKLTPSKAASYQIIFKSGKSKIASVSKDGTVKGLKPGTVTITATTYNGKKGKITIKVKK